MKKIIISLLIVALCVPALFACDEATGNMAESFPSTIPQVTPPASDSPVSDVQAVAKMYEVSQPTKVVAITKQVLIDGILELNCSYEMVTGYIDGLSAYVYKSSVEGVDRLIRGRNEAVHRITDLPIDLFYVGNPSLGIDIDQSRRVGRTVARSCLSKYYVSETVIFTVNSSYGIGV